tara:strand:- start:265 stop:591 length:327 start_codon:yes stop_codon:yes gene_type:complete
MIKGVQVHGNSKKKLTPKDRRAAIEHAKWLKSMGVGKVKADSGNKIPVYRTEARVTSDEIPVNGAARESMTYSGERQLLGIATMHKSNMVPIFADRKEDAKAVARMRR